MITYELAKELKDNGFPQENVGDYIHSSNGQWEISCDCGALGESAYLPTLSELIESCGDGFYALEKENYWRAFNWKRSIEFFSSTPEEAVAKLWLALNKK